MPPSNWTGRDVAADLQIRRWASVPPPDFDFDFDFNFNFDFNSAESNARLSELKFKLKSKSKFLLRRYAMMSCSTFP